MYGIKIRKSQGFILSRKGIVEPKTEHFGWNVFAMQKSSSWQAVFVD